MRTFVAIEIPSDLKQRLRAQQKRLQDRLASPDLTKFRQTSKLLTKRHEISVKLPPVLRWTNTDNLHLTLRFLGETEDARRRRMQAGLAEIAAAHEPFTLALSGLGCFHSWEKLRVLWVGISGETAALQSLQAEIETLARQAGFEPERRPFSPHITLARSVRGAPRSGLHAAAQQLRRAAAEEAGHPMRDWRVRQLDYIRSQPGKGGSQYSTLGRFRLAPATLTFHC